MYGFDTNIWYNIVGRTIFGQKKENISFIWDDGNFQQHPKISSIAPHIFDMGERYSLDDDKKSILLRVVALSIYSRYTIRPYERG